MAELRALSTRATITSTRFVNVYHWGDFKGDPLAMMERYFDAFVYVANWGAHELLIRLPRSVLDLESVRPYCVEDCSTVHVKDDHVILGFFTQDHEGG